MPVYRAGKVPPSILEKDVFPFLGTADPDVLHGPGIGRDAALVRVGQKVVVATTDPITGAVKNIGAYALHICANDVATFGINPRWFLATILLPEETNPAILREIMNSMHIAANELKVSIIGGHTEITPGLSRPIVVGFMLGTTEEGHYVTSTSAQSGNKLILTKGVAIEGTAILATERKTELLQHLDQRTLTRAQQFFKLLSVVPDALKAMTTGAVTAMHDPTEGGIANGLHELAEASGLGFVVDKNKLVIHEETRKICEVLTIDPMNLIASGAMLIAVQSKKSTAVIQTLSKGGISAEIIGELVRDSSVRMITGEDGTQQPLEKPKQDALWEALAKPL